jgi:predicted nucleotidyltransferase
LFKKLITKLAQSLNKKKIPYMIIGGQAVLIYGEPRFTRDIDITLGINVDKMSTIFSLCKELKLKILPKDPNKFILETMVLPVIEEKSEIKVDFIFSFSVYEQEALKRIHKIKIGKTIVNFIGLEDLIIHKLISGREKDLEDIHNILLVNPKYETKYIEKWINFFENELLLEKSIAEIWNKIKKA